MMRYMGAMGLIGTSIMVLGITVQEILALDHMALLEIMDLTIITMDLINVRDFTSALAVTIGSMNIVPSEDLMSSALTAPSADVDLLRATMDLITLNVKNPLATDHHTMDQGMRCLDSTDFLDHGAVLDRTIDLVALEGIVNQTKEDVNEILARENMETVEGKLGQLVDHDVHQDVHQGTNNLGNAAEVLRKIDLVALKTRNDNPKTKKTRKQYYFSG